MAVFFKGDNMSEANLQELRNVPIQSPSQEDWAIQEARQRREMGGTVDQVFSSRNMGEAVRRLHQKRQEEQRRLLRTVWKEASIVNLMPFPLNVNGVLHARLAGPDGNQVPECPVGKRFVRKVISELQWDVRDEGAGMDNVDNYTPVIWFPMDLAHDYEREFLDRMGVGGVIIYEGKQEPEGPEFEKMLENARKARNRWLLRKVQEAEADWADTSGRGRKNITELHRKAAEVLLHDKVLKHQPAWLLAINAEGGETPDPCPGCGAVSDANALICKNCSYVHKPIAAYKAAMIAYDDMSMERLTTDEWNEVNAIRAQREEARKAAKEQIG